MITLGEGATPLLPAPVVSARTGCEVYLKVEGANPTGSFKDRGMTVAVSMAVARGATAVICASTGNTSASAAAYAARAGLHLRGAGPARQDRSRQAGPGAGARGEAAAGGRQLRRLPGARPQARQRVPGRPGQLGEPGPAGGPEDRGLRDRRGPRRRPRRALPAGRERRQHHRLLEGYREYAEAGLATHTPRMFGFQASGAAPIVRGEPVLAPHDDRHRDQDRQPGLLAAGRGGARRLGRPHRRGDRPPDTRRLPDAGRQGGGVRRAGVGGRSRRADPGPRERAA